MEDGHLCHVAVLRRQGFAHSDDVPLRSHAESQDSAHIAVLLEELHLPILDMIQRDMVPDGVNQRVLRHKLGVIADGTVHTERVAKRGGCTPGGEGRRRQGATELLTCTRAWLH